MRERGSDNRSISEKSRRLSEDERKEVPLSISNMFVQDDLECLAEVFRLSNNKDGDRAAKGLEHLLQNSSEGSIYTIRPTNKSGINGVVEVSLYSEAKDFSKQK